MLQRRVGKGRKLVASVLSYRGKGRRREERKGKRRSGGGGTEKEKEKDQTPHDRTGASDTRIARHQITHDRTSNTPHHNTSKIPRTTRPLCHIHSSQHQKDIRHPAPQDIQIPRITTHQIPRTRHQISLDRTLDTPQHKTSRYPTSQHITPRT